MDVELELFDDEFFTVVDWGRMGSLVAVDVVDCLDTASTDLTPLLDTLTDAPFFLLIL